MALVIESKSTQSYTAPTGNGFSITKPTGLAVGDLMVACVSHFAEVNNVNTVFTTPAGWTSVENERSGLGSDGTAFAIFYKVADSSDVSASDFTFSVVSAQEYLGGCIFRVSGVRTDITVLGGSDNQFKENVDNPSYTVSLSPAQDNVLYIATFTSANPAYNTTDVTITGTNPTWTQQFDASQTISETLRFEVFTAIDTSAESNITSLTPTETGSSAFTDSWGTLTFFLGKQDVTGTLEFIEETDTVFDVSGSAGVHGTLEFIEEEDEAFDVSGKVTKTNPWTNETNPTATWTNESL